MLRVVN